MSMWKEPEDLGILQVCEILHTDHTGSLHEIGEEIPYLKYISYLEDKLQNWKPSTKSVDNAIRMLVITVLSEFHYDV